MRWNAIGMGEWLVALSKTPPKRSRDRATLEGCLDALGRATAQLLSCTVELKQLDGHGVAGCRREPAVARKQSSAKFFGKRDVGRIVGRQIMTELPNPGQQNEVGIPSHSQVEQILDRLIGARRCNRAFPHQTPQDLADLQIEEVRGMQGFVLRVKSVLNPLPRRGLKQPVNGGRGVEDDHRGLRSSCAFFLNEASRIECDRNRLALMQMLAELGQSWPLGYLFNLREQIVGQRHARHSGSGFQSAMQGVRHIAKLNHLRHVLSILSCGAHVNYASNGKCSGALHATSGITTDRPLFPRGFHGI
jgi:hypothetical protein